MTKRIAAIVGVLLVLGVTAGVAVAIWPERAGNEGSTSTNQARTNGTGATDSDAAVPGGNPFRHRAGHRDARRSRSTHASRFCH